jgi:hypothetical protein
MTATLHAVPSARAYAAGVGDYLVRECRTEDGDLERIITVSRDDSGRTKPMWTVLIRWVDFIGQWDVCVEVDAGKPGWLCLPGEEHSRRFATEDAEDIPEAWADCAHAEATTWKLTDPRGSVWKATATWEKH